MTSAAAAAGVVVANSNGDGSEAAASEANSDDDDDEEFEVLSLNDIGEQFQIPKHLYDQLQLKKQQTQQQH